MSVIGIISSAIGGIAIFYMIKFALWVWALVELINNWNTMKQWGQFIGVLGLVKIPGIGSVFNIGGSIITLCAVYTTKNSKNVTITTTPTPTSTLKI